MTLPTIRDPSKAQLIWFDLRAGTPTALATLQRHLSAVELARALLRFGWRSATQDPLRGIETKGWPAEQEPLVRHQLKPVLLLDDTLRHDLGLSHERTMAILLDVVRMSGARFIEHNVPAIPPDAWAAANPETRYQFIERLTRRLFNARVEHIEAQPKRLSFQVTSCRFVQLCAALDRSYLAPLFCAADSQFFDSPTSPKLTRPSTLAGGGPCCHFIFSYDEPEA
jgi:hypothetical protein